MRDAFNNRKRKRDKYPSLTEELDDKENVIDVNVKSRKSSKKVKE